MKIFIEKLRNIHWKIWLAIFVVTVAAILILPALIDNARQNKEREILSKKVSTSKGIVGATQFTQVVYNTYLKESYNNELTFIKTHQDWFVKRPIGKHLSKGTSVLLCNVLSQRPDYFKASSSVLSKDKKIANVYVQAYRKNKPISNNQLITLKSSSGSWVINGPSCYLD